MEILYEVGRIKSIIGPLNNKEFWMWDAEMVIIIENDW